jgi:hypothetical protein
MSLPPFSPSHHRRKGLHDYLVKANADRVVQKSTKSSQIRRGVTLDTLDNIEAMQTHPDFYGEKQIKFGRKVSRKVSRRARKVTRRARKVSRKVSRRARKISRKVSRRAGKL